MGCSLILVLRVPGRPKHMDLTSYLVLHPETRDMVVAEKGYQQRAARHKDLMAKRWTVACKFADWRRLASTRRSQVVPSNRQSSEPEVAHKDGTGTAAEQVAAHGGVVDHLVDVLRENWDSSAYLGCILAISTPSYMAPLVCTGKAEHLVGNAAA